MSDNAPTGLDEDMLSDTRSLLDFAEDAAPVDTLKAVAAQLLSTVGATQVGFLIADLAGERLVPITRVAAEPADADGAPSGPVPINDSHAGTALRRQHTQIISDGGDTSLFAPVTSRGDAIGVLELTLPGQPSATIVEKVDAAAHTLAYIVIANRRYTDLFEWRQRNIQMTLAAEIQRRIIPGAFTCEAGWFTVAGWLQPSTNVAGDTFDYSFDESNLTLSMTDAMGHSVESALLATVAVAALRNSRQASADLVERASAANAALEKHATNDQFVTGLLVNIPLNGDPATFVNAGHPAPYLVRDGIVTKVAAEADLPFGMFADSPYHTQQLDMRLGDRLLLVTDGLLERNRADFDIEAAIVSLGHLHARELVRQLCEIVSAASGGQLQDDATVLCFDWHDEPGTKRRSKSGSDEVGASQ